MRRFAGVARALGSGAAIDVLVTAPGRQAANADELVAALSRASGLPVRVLTREEEGVLAYEGALGSACIERWPAAVCDVGGGSTEITVGDLARGPFWSRSADVGSLRLTASTLRGDPPTAGQLAEAAALVASELEPVRPPATGTALVVGGAARALARLEGRRLDVAALGRALDLVATRPAADVARSTGLDPQRAATLAGGAVILLELARRLGPLHVGDGGLREGAVARLLAECEAA